MATAVVNYQNFVRVTLVLTPGEAEQLKNMMQNPVISPNDEPEEAFAVRQAIFQELKQAGV
ncbi:hypothetical protein [Erwinia phage phiEaP8]|uniref:Uncharacterized protein n=2 Tax=Caudoviricetes TaxID=2731619 RepID=A0A3G1QTP9_9CAUD|nr:hypothetical protein HYP64_gp58 [Erwinia phage phiEaP8]AWN06234.1 hypothetical protein [Erwinia phage phiEaP8]